MLQMDGLVLALASVLMRKLSMDCASTEDWGLHVPVKP